MNVNCPSCDRDDFDTSHAMRIHHARSHGESIRFEIRICENCDDEFEGRKDKDRRFCGKDCWDEYQKDRVEVSCEVCGEMEEVVSSYAGSYRFCSYECRDESMKRRVEKICPNCDDEFEVPKSNGDRYTCCSIECSNEYRVGENASNYNSVEITCEYCGEIKTRPVSLVEGRQRNFCDRECHSLWQKETDENVGENNSRWNRVEVYCDWCNESISKQPSEVTDLNFCNPTHKGMWMSENRIGENHPRWSGGDPGYYGVGWISQRRESLERDEYQCRSCGLDDKSHVDKFGWSLEVHHIIPYREFDSDEEANKMSNLVTLCRDCHISIESLSESEQREKLAV